MAGEIPKCRDMEATMNLSLINNYTYFEAASGDTCIYLHIPSPWLISESRSGHCRNGYVSSGATKNRGHMEKQRLLLIRFGLHVFIELHPLSAT